jgi:hypothetical protein
MIDEMRLDGNAAGGELRQLFAVDVTVARVTCAGCRTEAEVGALENYAHEMGVVLRCGGCGNVVLRLVRTPHGLYFDSQGMARLVLPANVVTS